MIEESDQFNSQRLDSRRTSLSDPEGERQSHDSVFHLLWVERKKMVYCLFGIWGEKGLSWDIGGDWGNLRGTQQPARE